MKKVGLRHRIGHIMGGACLDPGPNCQWDDELSYCILGCTDQHNRKLDKIMALIDEYIAGGEHASEGTD